MLRDRLGCNSPSYNKSLRKDKCSNPGHCLQKNKLPDGCRNEDGSYVFTNFNSLMTNGVANFAVNIDGTNYTGGYKGLAIISADKKSGLKKFAANGFTELSRDGEVILSFKEPVNIFITKQNGKINMVLKDSTKTIKPLINRL